jgi:hypothetical protein
MMDANIKGKNAELIKENSQKIANSSREMLKAYEDKTIDSGGILDSSFLYKDMSAEELADKFLSEESGMSKFVGSLGGGQSAIELFSSFNADENMTNDVLRSALMSFGYSASELENYGDTRLRQMYSNAMLSDFAKQAGYDEFSTQVLKKTYDKYKDNHAVYLEADSKFQENWKKAIESVPESNRNSFASVYNAYVPITGDPELDNTVDVNNVHLVEHFGYDSIDKYKFKAGLTSAPFDGYPAYLHTGERVLTKEEARAYNELSANAVEQLSTMSDMSTYLSNVTGDTYEQVFNSENLGTDKLNKSIETQTTSLEKKLDIVINALNTLIVALRPAGRSVTRDANVMAMNSNITQLATAK